MSLVLDCVMVIFCIFIDFYLYGDVKIGFLVLFVWKIESFVWKLKVISFLRVGLVIV